MAILDKKLVIENDLILRAASGEDVERAPVWMMRQAGRYMPEYRAVREEYSFLELCKTPSKAAEVSLQPLRALGVDAIIMFSDILIPLEPMGAPVSFATGSPKFAEPIRTAKQVSAIKALSKEELASACHFVYETIHEIKGQIIREEEDRLVQEVPVLGFAGAPWTLASYLIEGGGSQHFDKVKAFMYQERKAMHELLEKLAVTISNYLILKLDNGADMLQLFDTWAGQMSQEDYKEFALPYQQKIIAAIKEKYPEKKITLYVNGVANVIDYMIESGADVLSIDWRVNIAEIREYVAVNGRQIAIQGNLDPCHLLGPKELVLEKTLEMLTRASSASQGMNGYIANLGHGIMPEVPVENAQIFIDTVKAFKTS